MANEIFSTWVDSVVGTRQSDDYSVLGGANTVDMSQGGNDLLSISAYVGSVTMGRGDDTVVVDNFASVGSIDLGRGNNVLDAQFGGWIGSITGGNRADNVFLSNSGANDVSLGRGADVLASEGFVNTIDTGGGSDQVVLGAGANSVDLGAGGDFMQSLGFVGNIDAGGGSDFVVALGGANNVSLGNSNDSFFAGAWVNQVSGGRGRDIIELAAGGNAFGDAGRDTFIHGDGSDNFFGGSAHDLFVFDVDTAGAYDVVDGGSGNRDTLVLEFDGPGPELAQTLAELDAWTPGDAIYLSALNLQVSNVEIIDVDAPIV